MTSFVAIPTWLAAKATGSLFIIIVADVPDSGYDKWHPWVRMTQAENWLEWRVLGKADRLVCLSARTTEDFGNGRPCMVLECGVDETDEGTPATPSDSRAIPGVVVHAGSLGYLSGIDLLTSAMQLVTHPGAELHIYGDGPKAEQIAEMAKLHPEWLHYHGGVSHEEALRALEGASLLASPRLPDDNVTPYTFPSKIMEYLTTGVPVISNDLGGIGMDLKRFLIRPVSATPESWAEAIDWALGAGRETALADAADAQRYLASHKTWPQQAARLLAFLKQ